VGVGLQTEEITGRARVLDAAAELFVRQGYVGTTLRQIAAATGIKAGSIYHHFESKEALFVAVLNDGIVVMIDAFDEAQSSLAGTDDVAVHVREHVRSHLSAIFENGPYTTAHVTSFFSAPAEVRAAVVPKRDSYEQKWNQLFEVLFPAANTKELRLRRLILFGAMNATAEWFDPAGNLTVDQLAAAISDQFLQGVTQYES
jgi:AcrR family transcriptional regulator